MFDQYAFVAIATTDLERARRFWVEQLDFSIIREEPGHFFMLDAGGLKLCVDLATVDVHRAHCAEPVIGFKVASVAATLKALSGRGVEAEAGPIAAERGVYARLKDPDGRTVILTE